MRPHGKYAHVDAPHRKKRDYSKSAIVYRVVNILNGHEYIGVTTRSLYARRKAHIYSAFSRNSKGKFRRALRKYGVDNFEFEILENCSSLRVAFVREVFLIEKLNPHYNITRGGEGFLGARHSKKTKTLLKDLAGKNIDVWKNTYAKLGPASLRKQVVCLNTGEFYQSASLAAVTHGISRSIIIEVCNRNSRRKTARGLVFRYFGDHEGGAEEALSFPALRDAGRRKYGKTCAKTVTCINDGKTFLCVKEASKNYGLSAGYIAELCRKVKNSSQGLKFIYG